MLKNFWGIDKYEIKHVDICTSIQSNNRQTDERMNGWTDRHTDGRTDGWTGRRADG